MKRFLLLSLMMILAAPSLAQNAPGPDFGARAGLSFGPDQFHLGAHADMGALFTGTRLVPNVEIGFGDDLTVLSLAGDLLYDFPASPFSLGGELAFLYTSINADLPAGVDDSTTDLGLSALADYRLALGNGKTLTLEAKLGLIDAPDLKFTVMYDLF